MSGGLWAVSTWIQSPSAAGNPPAAARSQSATRHPGAYTRSVERAGAWLLPACKARICLALGLDMETLEEGKNASQIWGPLMRRRSCGWGKYGRAGVGVMQAARRRRLMPGRSRSSKIATGAQLAWLNVRLLWRCHPGSPLGTSSADHSTSVREPTLRFAPTASSVPALLFAHRRPRSILFMDRTSTSRSGVAARTPQAGRRTARVGMRSDAAASSRNRHKTDTGTQK